MSEAKGKAMPKEKVEELIRKQREFIAPVVFTYYKEPLVFVKGQGMYLYDAHGREYPDCFSGIATVQVGHGHPKVTEAVIDQIKKIGYTSSIYITEPQALLAEKVARIVPGKLKKSYFVNSGSEANEAAIQALRLATKKNAIFAVDRAYHGKTVGAGSLTALSSWSQNVPRLADIYHIPTSYCYRCPFGKERLDCDIECAQYLEEAIKANTPNGGAGMIIEPIHGIGGIIDRPVPEYFKIMREILDKYDMLLVSDEVQTGCGRTGKWWGIEQHGVEPDAITVAKGFGNGYPIGGFIAREEIAAELKPLTFFSTFGGNPISCIAALKTLEVIEEEKLIENAWKIGEHFKKGLEGLKEDHKIMGDVRGMGLMLGVEFVKNANTKEFAPEETLAILEKAKDKGILFGRGGNEGNVIRIQPPLIMRKEHVDKALEALDIACTEVEKGL
jgi:4-aminobutyrate aminotransferase-like enzyme